MSNWLQAIEEDLIVNEARDPSPLIYRGDWESEELKYELLKVFSLNTSNFDVRRFKNSIRAFTPIGIRAILPIYLRHCAKSKDSEVAEYLMYFLSDPGNGLDNNDAFTSVFNEKEKKGNL